MMLSAEVILIVILLAICVIQCQKYLDCTFDQGDLPCKLSPVGTSPELQVMSIVSIDNPSAVTVIPLSDVTSITKPTIGNNLQCQIPYKFSNDSEDMYFCAALKSSPNASHCITTDSTSQECILGQYVLAQLDSGENFTYHVEVIGTTGPSCLSLYYYITRPNVGQIVVRSTDIVDDTVQQIGTISDVPNNGWHRVSFSFQPNVTNYYINFDLERLTSSQELVFIALDQIKIIDGHCENVDETTTKADQTSPITTAEIVTTTNRILTTQQTILPSTQASSTPTPLQTTEITAPLSTQTAFDTTLQTTTTPIVTTGHPFLPIFQCDFTTSCFGSDAFRITNGTEFNPTNLSSISQPPEAPTSDVSSISNPTDNNEKCELPFRPQINNTTQTSWDMWFCYNEACPTASSTSASCVLGEYGLITLPPSQSNVTVTDSLTPNVPPKPRDASGAQCLRFYYYFTVYDGQDWGQQIQLWIKPNDGGDRVEVGTLTVNDMQRNKWESAQFELERISSNDMLEINFVIVNDTQEKNITRSQLINFAMDNIELYDYNCSYVDEQLGILTTTRPIKTSTSIATNTTTEPEATPRNKNKRNLDLILGLSLGIGGALSIIIIGYLALRCKAKGKARRKSAYEYDKYFPLESPLYKRNTK
ncbi:unnamed protein product [Adineta ricciae]|uniref:MAM domain-containing protein n=1 Tax=Adineta ricciae TaxID=249248 RepID=A0A814AJT4_ADIRI|nr:unnamed protein product [Adineta ricciae]